MGPPPIRRIRKIHSAAMNAFDLLYEGDSSTASSLRSARKQVEELARYEPKFQEALAALESALISVEDVGATLRDYAGGIHASPEHLAEVEDRLASIDRLKRKYGATLDDVIAFGTEAARKLSEMENKDEVLRQLRSELAVAAQEYLTAARGLSKKRYEAARKLEKLVEAAVNDLAKSGFPIYDEAEVARAFSVGGKPRFQTQGTITQPLPSGLTGPIKLENQ